MGDYLFLMQDDATAEERSWEPYLRKLRGCCRAAAR